MRLIADRGCACPGRSDANLTFGRYKGEGEQAVGRPIIKMDAFKEFQRLWRDFRYSECDDEFETFHSALLLTRGHGFTPKDIEDFSIMLSHFQQEKGFSDKAGYLISALIEEGKGRHYVLHTGHLDDAIDNLGYSNSKKLVVKGDAGESAGSGMLSGTLVVEGNCGDNLGAYMAGGNIVVHGNAEDCAGSMMCGGSIRIAQGVGNGLGYQMGDGEIVVCGNVYGGVGTGMMDGAIHVHGDVISLQDDPRHRKMMALPIPRSSDQAIIIGYEMKGGEIHLEGRYRHIADEVGKGRIFHKGKLIRPKSE